MHPDRYAQAMYGGPSSGADPSYGGGSGGYGGQQPY
jgi:hypothetical protein